MSYSMTDSYADCLQTVGVRMNREAHIGTKC